jgi:hypothetical protein
LQKALALINAAKRTKIAIKARMVWGQRQRGTMAQPSPLMDFCDFGAPVLSALLLPRTKKGVKTDTLLLAGGGGPHSGVPNGIVREDDSLKTLILTKV